MKKNDILSWVHFGDLHITEKLEQNFRDFSILVADANLYLAGVGGVDFAVLPGDNADDGSELQFLLVRSVLEQLKLPVHILPGDHDVKGGNLDDFYRCLRTKRLPYAITIGNTECLFLNSVDNGTSKGFGFGEEQIKWLKRQLSSSQESGRSAVLFMHTYPSELGDSANAVNALLPNAQVLAVDMGHTHYNEIANDGKTIYAATRSTGQIEEGPVGFSVAAIDAGVVSWKFKALEKAWPLVLITSPADQHFIIAPDKPDQVVRGNVTVRAKVWGRGELKQVSSQVDNLPAAPMTCSQGSHLWSAVWNSDEVSDGMHQLTVRAYAASGIVSEDSIEIVINQSGLYHPPVRKAVDHLNAIGAHEHKGLLGTQLGPNKNGRKW